MARIARRRDAWQGTHRRSEAALPHHRVRDLLPDRARALLGADAAAAPVEAVHRRRQLRLLRGREPALLPAAGRHHPGQPGRGADARPHRGRAPPQVDHRPRRRAQPRRPSASSSTTRSSSRTSPTCSTRSPSASPLPLLTVALPIGISFFTFQAITYVVDVQAPAGRAGLDRSTPRSTSASSRTWWPGRSSAPASSCPSSRRRATPNRVAVGAGLALIALGLVKKVLIADYLARDVVDPVFGVPAGLRGARRCWSPPTPTRPRSTATSPATPTWRSGSRC